MRPANKALALMLMLLFLTVSPWVSTSGARSVHSTSTVDLFPQGSFTDAASWSVGAETSFTQEAATYTE
ncbi:MAG: hypothetical protein VXY68_07555, partial [Candidatus Thermoplasmatota archaeon]|nr:hypothetical protein [Candidatus Thermoplasmatota archaeon]